MVENRPGASTVTGTAALTQAAPDGHTVGMVFDSLAINAAFGMQLPYDSEKDIVPVIQLARVPLVLIVNSSLVPMKTLPELVAHAKAYNNRGVALIRKKEFEKAIADFNEAI